MNVPRSSATAALALIVIVRPWHAAGLQPFLQGIERWLRARRSGVKLVWVLPPGTGTAQRQQVEAWNSVSRVNAPLVEGLAQALAEVSALRVTFCEARTDDLDRLSGPWLPASAAQAPGAGEAVLDPLACWQMPRAYAVAALQAIDPAVRPELAAEVILWRALIDGTDGMARADRPMPMAPTEEPAAALWRETAHYTPTVRSAFLGSLEHAQARQGQVPAWLQAAVLRHLHWYFTVDARERAPTVIVDDKAAPAFHDAVGQTMRFIEPHVLLQMDAPAGTEVRLALLSYRGERLHTAVGATGYDHDQGLVRLNWWLLGEPEAERFEIDGEMAAPAHAKYRACNYFGRRLLRQRIVWLPAGRAQSLRVWIGGTAVAVGIGDPPLTGARPTSEAATVLAVEAACRAFPRGRGGQQPLPAGWLGWKVRLVKAAARLLALHKRFRGAWVFADRFENADDNAEHLYRWVREHHPEVNAWFVLRKDSPDWGRLHAEGFRLIAPGLFCRLLILNSRHVISSHTDLAYAGFERRHYGDAMRWSFVYLKHGPTLNDQSQYYNSLGIDLLISSGPAEHCSTVGDDTPYIYTTKEVHCTGMPRHDRLRDLADRMPVEARDLLLVMPTWRSGLDAVAAADLPDTDYARAWREFLCDHQLRAVCEAHEKRLVFFPHMNLLPQLSSIRLPDHVQVVRPGEESIQGLLSRSSILVTDYSSIAFEMGLMRRSVVYYQFDRERFYGGTHNWRSGYFSYESDGFGPVALSCAEMVVQVTALLQRDCRPAEIHLQRMRRALPHRDSPSCGLVYERLLAMRP